MDRARFAFREKFLEDERVDVAAARPQHHQHDHLQLVEGHDVGFDRHRALENRLAQARRQDARAFPEGHETQALRRDLGRLLRAIAAERQAVVELLGIGAGFGAGEAAQPVERVGDVLVLESRGGQLAGERVVVQRCVVLVVVFE
jgi:hypothetical protein